MTGESVKKHETRAFAGRCIMISSLAILRFWRNDGVIGWHLQQNIKRLLRLKAIGSKKKRRHSEQLYFRTRSELTFPSVILSRGTVRSVADCGNYFRKKWKAAQHNGLTLVRSCSGNQTSHNNFGFLDRRQLGRVTKWRSEMINGSRQSLWFLSAGGFRGPRSKTTSAALNKKYDWRRPMRSGSSSKQLEYEQVGRGPDTDRFKLQ